MFSTVFPASIHVGVTNALWFGQLEQGIPVAHLARLAVTVGEDLARVSYVTFTMDLKNGFKVSHLEVKAKHEAQVV